MMFLGLHIAFLLTTISLVGSEFLAGVDISHVAFFEERNVRYRDYEGQPQDLFSLLKKYEINCVRLRLFTSSDQQARKRPYDHSPNLQQVLKLAQRAHKNDLKILLDFHYSDTWADPGHQQKPKEWIALSFAQLQQRLYYYTKDTIHRFIQQGTRPAFVQIGNEITRGMLWPDGNRSNWTGFGALMRAGIQAVRDISSPSKILLQITRSTDWPGTRDFFDHAILEEKLDFDIIAQSYYPFFHGSWVEMEDCFLHTAARYDKQIILVETGYPWTNRTASNSEVINLTGFPTTPEGQADFAMALVKTMKRLPGRKGLGVFWWAAEYQPVSSYPDLAQFELRSFFNTDGYPLPILRRFGGSSEALTKPSLIQQELILVAMMFLGWICVQRIRRRPRWQ